MIEVYNLFITFYNVVAHRKLSVRAGKQIQSL